MSDREREEHEIEETFRGEGRGSHERQWAVGGGGVTGPVARTTAGTHLVLFLDPALCAYYRMIQSSSDALLKE